MTAGGRCRNGLGRTTALACAAFLAACSGGVGPARVVPPTADPSPPVASLNVQLARLVTLTTQDTTVSVHSDEDGALFGVADDPEGAQTVTLDGGYTVTCAGSGGTGQVKQGTFSQSTSDQRADGKVGTHQVVQASISYARFATECGGARPAEFHGTVRAVATNALGAKATSGRLTFASLSGPGQLRVATVNLVGDDTTAAGLGLAPFADRVDNLVSVLSGTGLVFLQEATDTGVSTLASRLNLQVARAVAPDGTVSDVALLSATPLRNVVAHVVPVPICVLFCPKGKQLVLEAVTTVSGRAIRVVAVHFTSDGTGICLPTDGPPCPGTPPTVVRTDFRAATATVIAGIVKTSPEPVLVGGDFNATLGSSELAPVATLVDALATVAPSRTDCVPAIDMFLSTALLRANAFSWKCGGDLPMELSDHPLVFATFGTVP